MRMLTDGPRTFAQHNAERGFVPWQRFAGRAALIDEVVASGLRGRGGGGFPTGLKLRAVTGRRPVVVANGCEGEPDSRKDHVLLSRSPHLVLDGMLVACHAIGAAEAVLCVHAGSPLLAGLIRALADRGPDANRIRIVEVPRRYVASEESALVNFLGTGDARPTTTPPRPTERGVDGRPTLVDNVETLAHLAIVARVSAEAFRADETTLVTTATGVHEVPVTTRLADLVTGPVLAGGYGGVWLSAARTGELTVAEAPGVAVFRTPQGCGLRETAGILAYLAAESARQCGPCMFGLPAIAGDFAELAAGVPGRALERLRRRLPVVTGRGACAHPDGAVRMASSALDVFTADVTAHATGVGCTSTHRRTA
ncbi:NADH-ubiquinone oxidoreductase-F iron-sulfur binding region domain-containing protein [Umezawaea tangerina]|uniref:NADH:ubiquinone oxidoreductase subunit F (NADH-binding) n=1 Tax=Umezawaea tangerina TaxID=84725 RepID=A0A2T0T4P6_9PSEU|nr:NADH-ubiquinone oxidoreductase-F iron-sulfur binding region domain-containing protein [Umezawaea tangerina]PRY40604.1 NADH:ubiquinone oxidoreductase subunit F (NADH-binding) [Umezawaea tangerina]